MNCSKCGMRNPAEALHCIRCGAKLVSLNEADTFAGISMPPLPPSDDPTLPPVPPRPMPASSMNSMVTAGPWGAAVAPALDTVDFGPRYRIDRLLGQGGMGAVYKAYDKELDRPVALKLIRPDLAAEPQAMARFKQELLLASKISHKNILRIHDLGEANGVKFISMAYVHGQDLHGLLQRGRLSVDEALHVTRQLCGALEAAHAEGVVHRDLKPQNVLLDDQRNVFITDFGLAKSLEVDTGMTMSGQYLGTPRYMAPEQVESHHNVDHRADLYALGLILFEMVTGDVPFHADTPLQLMYKRVHETPRSPAELNADLPPWLVQIIVKSIDRDPTRRYQSARAMLNDIDAARAPSIMIPPPVDKGPETRQISISVPIFSKKRIALVAMVVAVLVASLATPGIRHRIFKTSTPIAGPAKPITVLVADINNRTGDALLDSTLEPVINFALEGATFINAFNRGEALRLAKALPNPSDKLDEKTARLIAVNQGLGAVISGNLEKKGNGFVLSLTAAQAVTGARIAGAQVDVVNKDQLLFAVTKAAANIRTALGDSTSESDQIFALETLTAASLEAVHDYSLGIDAMISGRHADALNNFSKAVDLDPNFGLAIAGEAVASLNLAQTDKAKAYIQQALQHIDSMTERERYRTRGLSYLITENYQKCTEEYGSLVKKYSDVSATNNLGLCYAQLRQMSQAAGEMRRASEMLPNRASYRFNVAMYLALSGDFAQAEREATQALSMAPNFEKGYLTLAVAQSGEGKLDEARATYAKLAGLSASGATVAASALGDLAAYEGRYAESAKVLQDAAAADLKANNLDRAADKYGALAYTELSRGNNAAAEKAADNALAKSLTIKNRLLAGLIFARTGASAKARKLSDGLAKEIQDEPQSYAKLIDGEIALKSGDDREALKAFTDAGRLLDTWFVHFGLGRAYLHAGAFAEADSEFDLCLRRRGETLFAYMDDVPSYAYFPAVYYYQGQVREGLKTANFSDSYRQYLAIREKAGEDPLIADIHRRIGK